MASEALDQRQPLSAEAGSSALPAANRLEFVDNLRWGKDLPTEANLALPSDGQVLALALGMGICTFLVRIVQPIGTNILNMQLCFFSQYILLFSVGVLAWRRNWLLTVLPSMFSTLHC